MAPIDLKTLNRKYAVSSTVEWMDLVIRRHADTIKELERSKARFLESIEEIGKPGNVLQRPVDVIGSFVNAVNNGQMNFRLDLAPTRAAEIALAFQNPKD